MRVLRLLLVLLAFVPAAQAEGVLEWSGEARVRTETLENQFRPGREGGDQVLALRTSVHGTWTDGAWRFGAELMDSRAYLADSGSPISASEVNALDLVQAYAAYRFDGGEAMAGRFTLDLGSRRLSERPSFRNTVNSFTGGRVDWRSGDVAATAFYTLPVLRLPDDRASLLDNETAWDEESGEFRFWGALVRVREVIAGAAGEIYAFGLEERDGGGRATRDRRLVTPGVRLVRAPGASAWDFEIEAIAQFGEARATGDPTDTTDLDVAAHAVHAEFGYSFEDVRAALVFDLASGDASADDEDYGRFDNLFGSRTGDWGPTGIYGPLGPANVVSPGVTVEAAPAPHFQVFARYRALFLDEAADSFASTGVRDVSGASGNEAGHALDVRVRTQTGRMEFEIGAAALFNGAFLERAPNATRQGDTRYAYASATYRF